MRFSILFAAILFSTSYCMVIVKEPDLIFNTLAKRQAPSSPQSSSGSSDDPHMILDSSKKRKLSTPSLPSSLPDTDRKALNALEMFLNDDHITLQQALDKHMNAGTSHGPSDSHSSTNKLSHTSKSGIKRTSSELKLFTEDVLHRKKKQRPEGYDTVKQMAARHAEELMKKGNYKEADARRMGKEKIQERNNRRQERDAYWSAMADKDPSLARFDPSNVPTRIAKHRYIPLRAYQLNHQGKAKTMPLAREMARAEIEKVLARKQELFRNRREKMNQKKQA